MTDYAELVKALRICGKGDCVDCDRQRQDKCLKRHLNNEDLIDGILCEAASAIEDLQAQLPKRGKWIYKPKDAIELMFTLPKCSVCGHESPDANNYCPNCGADLRAKMEVQG